MAAFLAVGAGGFLGALLRYLISRIPIPCNGFPVLTLLINITGSFLIGITVGLALKQNVLSDNMLLFLKVGVCGGFTTFSSFALESGSLFSAGKPFIALSYIILSVVLCILSVYLGQMLIKR